MPVLRKCRKYPVRISKEVHLCLTVHADCEFAERPAQTQFSTGWRIEQGFQAELFPSILNNQPDVIFLAVEIGTRHIHEHLNRFTIGP